MKRSRRRQRSRLLRGYGRPIRKKTAIRKHRQHIMVYSLLGIAIMAVRLLFPEVMDLALNEVQTLSQEVVAVAKDGTTAILTIAGLVYAWKSLSKF